MTVYNLVELDIEYLKDNLSTGLINQGKFNDVLELPFSLEIVERLKKSLLTLESWCNEVNDYLSEATLDNKEASSLSCGIAALLIFIQHNWTGPAPDKAQSIDLNINDERKKTIVNELDQDGEGILNILECPELLLLSKAVLKACYTQFPGSKVSALWYLRALFIQQQILEENSPAIFEELNFLIDKLKGADSRPVWNLEFAEIHHFYGYVQKAKQELDECQACLGISISLSGALGKRTRFQQTNLSQLVFKVEQSADRDEGATAEPAVKYPVDLILNDEVRLDRIKYENDVDGVIPELTGLQQAFILGHLKYTSRSQARDEMLLEEILPMAECILRHPKVWLIQLTTLLERSKMESNNKRTVERSMMQTQALLDAVQASDPAVTDRLRYFFVSYAPTKHKLQTVLADVLISLGSVKSALDLYLVLEEWEKAISCYILLQLRHKAQEIIERELAKEETPRLWCLLGDATDNPEYYEKAWELSGHRSARAQRQLAMFYYNKGMYKESIAPFERTLEINSLQASVWHSLGFAALQEARWETAANAYRRYCSIDSECFKAWNNLARCYCEMKQTRRAWRALQEALKLDFSNHKVWENYMLVSLSLKELDEVVRSYHELLHIREKHVDIPVLRALVIALCELVAGDEKETTQRQKTKEEVEKLQTNMLALFGRLTSKNLNNADLFFLYSEVPMADTPANLEKRHQLLLKAHRAAMNQPGWEKVEDSCKPVVHVLLRLLEVTLQLQQLAAMTSSKMAVSGAMSLIKKQHPGSSICDELDVKLQELLLAIETNKNKTR